MRFYSDNASLTVKDGNEQDILIAARFMRGENQTKFADYMRVVAERLNEMEPFSDEMTDYLEVVDQEVSDAKMAERFLEVVTLGAQDE